MPNQVAPPDEPDEPAAPRPTNAAATQAPAPTPTPTELPAEDAERLPLENETDLAVLGSSSENLADVLERYNASFVVEIDGSAHQIRFPVDSLDELTRIRDELSAQGFNVQLSYADDEATPGESGDS